MLIKPSPTSPILLSAGTTGMGNSVPDQRGLLSIPHGAARVGRIAAAGLQVPPLWRSAQENLEALLLKAMAGDGLAADSLWIELAKNFGLSIPGANVSVRDARTDLASPLAGNISLDQEFVGTTLEKLGPDRAAGDSGKFIEIQYRSQNYRHRMGARQFLRYMEYALRDRIILTHYDKDRKREVIRIPTPSFLESMLQIAFGPESVRWKYDSGEIAPETIIEYYRAGQRAVGLVLKPIFLGDVRGEVHPFLFALHDIYHGANFAENQPLRKAVLDLCDAVLKLPVEVKTSRDYKQVLGRLIDMELGKVENLDEHIFRGVSSDFTQAVLALRTI